MGESIEVGDRVVNLQMPGVFRVVARHGLLLDIESALGVRMTLRPEALRKLDETGAT